eukprot:gene23413-biopygen7288
MNSDFDPHTRILPWGAARYRPGGARSVAALGVDLAVVQQRRAWRARCDLWQSGWGRRERTLHKRETCSRLSGALGRSAPDCVAPRDAESISVSPQSSGWGGRDPSLRGDRVWLKVVSFLRAFLLRSL